MKKFRRGLSRLVLHLINALIVTIELVDARSYMRFYTWFLKQYGVIFTGIPRYISSKARFDDFELVTIGERVVISKYVILLTHDYSITTAMIANGDVPSSDVAIRRPIIIGDNVFIGMGAIILPGTSIGSNVIVGAGSVVRGSIEPDSVVVGNPAAKIGTLTGQPDKWRSRASGVGVSMDSDC